MASIEMPGQIHQLGSKRVAVGAAFLHQVCPSGCDPQEIVHFQVPSPLLLRLSIEEKKPALAPNGFTTVLELIGVSKHSCVGLKNKTLVYSGLHPGFHSSSYGQEIISSSQNT